jgi:hypothetical protein
MRLSPTSFGASVLMACLPVLADSPVASYAWVTTSSRGDHLFKMVPATLTKKDGEWVTVRDAFGVAYRLDEKGEFQEIWRSTGWYAFKGHLSDDGRYFVRFGPWASDQDNHTDLAIAFYDRGQLVKEYQVRDLIQEPDLLEDSVSHYTWRPSVQTHPNGFHHESLFGSGDEQFRLTMIDKTTYDFDVGTGRILNKGRDESAKSSSELMAKEMAAEAKRGKTLFDGSGFKEAFLNEFEISDISANSGSYSSTSLEGPSWEATLKPRKALDHEVSIKPLFPIREDGEIAVSITPQEIISAIERALKHPYVKERFENGGATGIRMRVLGDRLHWNSTEISGFLELLTGGKPAGEELKSWCYFIIDAAEPRYTGFYFDAKSGRIITNEDPEKPGVPSFIDAAGERLTPR